MAVEHFTKDWLKVLPAPERATVYYDEKLAGFGLRVAPPSQRQREGARSWFIEYRPGEGGRGVPKKRMVFADARKLDNPDEARRQAKKLLAKAELGADPAGERAAARDAESVSDLFETYLRESTATLKPGTVKTYRGYIKNHIKPTWGARKANTITRKDVRALHNKIGRPKDEGGRGTPGAANRLLTFLSGGFNWAIGDGFLPKDFENPAKVSRKHNNKGIRPYNEKSCERFLNAEEFARLGEALRLAEGDGIPWTPRPGPKAKHAPKPENRRVIVDPYAAAAIRLLIFTGLRLREILHLKWADVDFQRGRITLPDSKVGRRPVLLGAPALQVLADLEPDKLGIYVIASESVGKKDERPRADLHRPWRRIIAHADLDARGEQGEPDYRAGLRIHDLRHSFASVGVGGGLGLPIIGRALGHADISTTQKYAHLADDPLRRAADAIGRTLEAQLAGKTGVVVSMNRGEQ